MSTATKPFRSGAACYCLVLRHHRAETLTVGAFGSVEWESGWLYYVGRASYGWGSRLKRFQRDSTSTHWHIDYLVASEAAELSAVIPFDVDPDRECRIARRVGAMTNVRPIARGFGASDCEENCQAHGWVGDHDPADLVDWLAAGEHPPAGRVMFESSQSRWIPASAT